MHVKMFFNDDGYVVKITVDHADYIAKINSIQVSDE